jgi:hypothetical protein
MKRMVLVGGFLLMVAVGWMMVTTHSSASLDHKGKQPVARVEGEGSEGGEAPSVEPSPTPEEPYNGSASDEPTTEPQRTPPSDEPSGSGSEEPPISPSGDDEDY